MRRDDLCLTIPSFFRCPISMDVMKSPVILSTGVTYDRTSIQQWLDNGNNTCPATMQILPTQHLLPNHTLRRLILLWSTPHLSLDPAPADTSHSTSPSSSPEAKAAALRLLELLSPGHGESKLALAGSNTDSSSPVEAAPSLLVSMTSVKNDIMKSTDVSMTSAFFFSISALLRRGSSSEAAAIRLLELLSAGDGESKLALAEDDGVLNSILALADPSSSSPPTIEAALSLLIGMTSVKTDIMKRGVLGMTKAVLCSPNVTVGAVEKGLALLERASVGEMCREEGCVAAVVERSLRVSAVATECAVRILWRVCCLEGEGREEVGRSNGVSKMLLVMQSYCSPEVRRMAGDVLKVCTRGGGCSSRSSSYHTNTAHITPF